jgi:DNA (cytosine-5)-methyltransferase 1
MEAVVEKMWPTPRTSGQENLDTLIKRKGEKAAIQHNLTAAARHKENKGGGTLNPTWVEWLMGYPAGYTDLKDWAILSSRKSRKK